jgi:hypothetical protein
MREREEKAILKKLDEIREDAVAKSRAVGVLVGLDSFLSTKIQTEEKKMEEQAAVERAGIEGSDDGEKESSTLSKLSTGQRIPLETYVANQSTLEETMKTWLLHSNTNELCFPPELTTGQSREMDFVVVVFGIFFTRMLFSGSALLMDIAIQCLDRHLARLAKELGPETVFKVSVFLLSVITESKIFATNTPVRESAIHLMRSIFSVGESDESDVLVVSSIVTYDLVGEGNTPGTLANCHRIFPITFRDFHQLGLCLHFTLTVLCVLSRRLLTLCARHS